jgi:hypothetical protein
MIDRPRCATPNPPDARFCSNCGQSLVTRAGAQAPRRSLLPKASILPNVGVVSVMPILSPTVGPPSPFPGLFHAQNGLAASGSGAENHVRPA